jgi:hypothetical protein
MLALSRAGALETCFGLDLRINAKAAKNGKNAKTEQKERGPRKNKPVGAGNTGLRRSGT